MPTRKTTAPRKRSASSKKRVSPPASPSAWSWTNAQVFAPQISARLPDADPDTDPIPMPEPVPMPEPMPGPQEEVSACVNCAHIPMGANTVVAVMITLVFTLSSLLVASAMVIDTQQTQIRAGSASVAHR